MESPYPLRKLISTHQLIVSGFHISLTPHPRIQPNTIKTKLATGLANYTPCLACDAFAVNDRNVCGVDGQRERSATPLLSVRPVHLHPVPREPSVPGRALQTHDGEGSSGQFLVHKEHEGSCEHCLEQLGFKAFVESYYSKAPERKEVGKK